jgi:hypothetical protein
MPLLQAICPGKSDIFLSKDLFTVSGSATVIHSVFSNKLELDFLNDIIVTIVNFNGAG